MSAIARIAPVLCLAAANLAAAGWSVKPPVLLPGPAGAFDETAVKDPSIVRYNGRWHVFYTARGQNRYSIGYVSATSLEALQTAPRVELTQLRGRAAYSAAPQVFFFTPQRKWYLIYQTTDENYQPVFSTTAALDKPDSWTAPTPLLEKQDQAKWIDFWVICDRETAYLFFTRGHKDVVVMTTSKAEFPKGFHGMRPVFQPLMEAAHIYKLRNRPGEWMMLFETAEGRLRRYGLATAKSLAGEWTLVTPDFATGAQLQFPAGVQPWTDEVSHGELIRSGYDEFLEVDDPLQFLIQGISKDQHNFSYPSLPWRLGLIERGAH